MTQDPCQETDIKIKAKSYKCPHCPRTFEGPVHLGGHVSKVHKNMSLSYNKKMKTREQNAQLREFRKIAQSHITVITKTSYRESPRVYVTLLTKLYLQESQENDTSKSGIIKEKIEALKSRIAKTFLKKTEKI